LLQTQANGINNGCTVSLPLLAIIVAASVIVVGGIERNPDYTAKRQQRAWELLAQASSGGGALVGRGGGQGSTQALAE